MGVTPASPHDDAGSDQGVSAGVSSSVGAARFGAPTRQLIASQVGDTCVSCEAPLASDQRYCLNCGERRGKSRFAAAGGAGQSAPRPPERRAEPREPHRRRVTSGTTLVAGIATLLLAMGVGIEIGRISNGNNSGSANPARASAPSVQVVTVGSGGGGTAPAAVPSSSGSATKSGAKASHTQSAATKTVVTKKVAAKATQAASKVLGASAKNLAPPTVNTGQSCSSGAGCQNGRFTGNFFGP